MDTQRGNRLSVRVLVRGRIEDPLEEYKRLAISETERRRRATRYTETGDRIAAREPYRAMEQYRIALALLGPLPERGNTYIHANRQIQVLDKRIQDEYRDLSSAVNVAAEQGDADGMVAKLHEVVELIPDERDPRHQRATMLLKSIIAEVYDKKKKKR